MEMHQLLSKLDSINESYLYEGLDDSSRKSIKLWESAGYAIKEAALTPDQIQQLFTSVEQGATDAGGNRTMLGQGKDAAVAVNKAWEDLKTKVQDSKPIKAVDQAYDDAVAKIEAGLGGPDNAVNQVIQKYRTFAKEHPVAQSFIYAALIAAAGISGAGLGGAAVLGLLKMADKLLQGEKFSSAAYAGAKTGATAYGASKLGDYVKAAKQAADYGGEEILPVVGQNAADAAAGATDTVTKVAGAGLNAFKDPAVMNSLASAAKTGGKEAFMAQINQIAPAMSQNAKEMMFQTAMRRAGVAESIKLSETQIQALFLAVDDTIVLEGIMDKVKQFGKNLTTKVTADKLNKAWKSAGSPTDSNEVAAVLKDAGVTDDVIAASYKSLGIEAPTPAPADSGSPESPKSVNNKQISSLMAQIEKLDPDSRKEVLAYLQR